MTNNNKNNQIVVRPSLAERRQAIFQARQSGNTHRLAEFAGNTTAGLAAVMLCFPVAVVDFMALTMYRVPKGLCKSVLQKKNSRKLLGNGAGDDDDSDLAMHAAVAAAAETFMDAEGDQDVIAMENEMWEKFNESGFCRTSSERVEDDVVA